MNELSQTRTSDRPNLNNPSRLITRSFQQRSQPDWITNLFSSFLLDHLIMNAIAMIGKSLQADKRKVNITLEPNHESVVYADQDMVYAIIYQLVTSAIGFSGADETVNISSQVFQNMVTISISSTGIGISPERLHQLFQIDTRPIRLSTIDELFTGFELLVCHRFTEKNRGKLSVLSGDTQGKIFMLNLPKSLH
ncbi:MAG: hypothetical protein DCE90_06505 [Pseudanabaena sp.]|nr:MAG: hypothetical protein DCE90_06505 [Pseudanabaena sp.]